LVSLCANSCRNTTLDFESQAERTFVMCANSRAENNLGLQDFRPLDAQPHRWQLRPISRVRIRQSICKKEFDHLPCVLDILAVR
jgi:hypothetical protein